MTSRERVLATLNHLEPDRVPIDLGGTVMSGIMALALDRLRKHLGVGKPVKVYEVFQMLGEVELDLVERFGVDTLPVEPLEFFFELKRERYRPWRLFDGTDVLVPGDFSVDVAANGDWLLHTAGDPTRPVEGRMPKDGYYFDMLSATRAVPNWSPPPLEELRATASRPSEEALRFMSDRAAYLRKHTDKALVLTGPGEWGLATVGSLPDQLMLIATDKEYVRDLLAIRAELGRENLRLVWEAVGDRVDVVMIDGQDFGTQRSEMFSPRIFEEYFAPSLTAQVQWIHEHTSWKVWEHTCGSILNILPCIVEAGVDALNPVQTSADGMAPEVLKKRFGNKITFWGGGVDTQRTLPFGTPEEVREEVRERIRIFAPGGGFVFAAVHNIQANTPPENITAMFEAVHEFGKYPLSLGDQGCSV
jgi:hypothetical protein